MLTVLYGQDLEFMHEIEKNRAQPPSIRAEPLASDASLIFDEMYRHLEADYYYADTITGSIHLRNAGCHVNSSCHTYKDPMRGQVFRFTSNTPLACSFEQLNQLLWHHVSRFDAAKEMGVAFARVSTTRMWCPRVVSFSQLHYSYVSRLRSRRVDGIAIAGKSSMP